MASTIDIYLNKSGGLLPLGSALNGTLPALTRNDQYPVRLRVMERNENGAYTDASLSSPSFKLGIGNLDALPTSGQFKLVLNSTTSSAISYNATTTQVLNAISGIAGNVGVATYGPDGSAWIITAATANTALSFGGSSFTLFPDSSVLVNTRRFPASSIYAEQVIELSRNPAVYSDTFTATSGDFVSLNKIQIGDAQKNETYELLIGNDVLGGSFSLGFNNYSVAADYNTTPDSLASQLTAITGIGANNISVQSNNKRGFIITFVNQLGLQAVVTPLLLDSSGMVAAKFYETALTMSTVQVDDLFVEAGTDTITPTIEISLTESGREKTIYQGSITIQKDLITTGAAVPAQSAQYYTKAEVDAGFVPVSASNVDSSNRILYSGTAQKSVDYGSRLLNDSGNTIQLQWGSAGVTIGNTLFASGPIKSTSSISASGAITFGGNLYVGGSITVASALNVTSTITAGGVLALNGNISCASTTGTKIGTTTSQKLGFFGSTPVVQPTDANAISCLASLGLFKDATTTYGVFPLSSQTLTTLSSVAVGTLGAGDSTTITISLVGAKANDVVLLGLPAGTTTGLIFMGHTSVTDVVDIDVFNYTNQSKTQNALTYRITVIGY